MGWQEGIVRGDELMEEAKTDKLALPRGIRAASRGGNGLEYVLSRLPC